MVVESGFHRSLFFLRLKHVYITMINGSLANVISFQLRSWENANWSPRAGHGLVQIPSQVQQSPKCRTAVWCQNGRLHEEGEEEDDAGGYPSETMRDLVNPLTAESKF